VGADCGCAGTIIYDCPALQANIGDSCDDGNADTENDVVGADCECAGTIISCTVPDFDFTVTNDCEADNYDVSALLSDFGTSSVITIYLTRSDAVPVNPVALISFLEGASVSIINNVPFGVTVTASIEGSNPACNLSNSFTQLICPPVYDCPALQANIGDACDDGDASTVNDVIGEDCNCAGESLIPVNDLPCDAIRLECASSVSGSTEFATSDNEPIGFCGTTPSAPGVWYSLIGTGAETTVSLCGSDYDTKLNIYTGLCDDLVCVTGNDDLFSACGAGNNSQVTFDGAVGTEYFIFINGFSGDVGDFALAITCVEFECPEALANIGDTCDDGDPTTTGDIVGTDCVCAGTPIVLPNNDECAGALEILVDSDPVTGDNTSATGNDIVINCGEFSETATQSDLWWFFTAPDPDQQIVIETFAGTNNDTQLQLFDACGGEVIACNDDGGSGLMSRITIPCSTLTPGLDYYIQVDGYGSNVGTFELSVTTLPCAPTTCEFIEYDLVVTGGGFPNEIDWTLTDLTENVVASGGAPTEGSLCLEDDCYVLNLSDSFGDGWNGAEFTLSSNGSVVAGPFTLDGGFSGSVQFSLGEASCPDLTPENDDCADAAAIACGDTLVGNTTGATASGLDTECSGSSSSDARDLFYTFEADGTSDYNVSLGQPAGSFGFDGVLFVYSGSCDDFTSLGCSDSGSIEEVELLALAAGTYTIRLFDYSGTAAFTLSLECIPNEGFDCPILEGNIGDSCDDGDDTTVNDVLDGECNCVGTPMANAIVTSTIPNWNATCAARNVTVKLMKYDINGNQVISTFVETLNDDGSFALTNECPAGTYDILFKVDGGLAVLSEDVTLVPGLNILTTESVLLGDINNDNRVNLLDISALGAGFGSVTGNSNFNFLADLNCDGNIGIIDVSIINNRFGMIGDKFEASGASALPTE
ncbi:hypothetical protein G3O08_18350, partial [Cryomorpha ignava]